MKINELINRFEYLNDHLLAKQLVILFIYALLAKIVDLFIDKILRRIAVRTSWKFDEQLIDFLHTPIYWSVFAVGVTHALSLQSLSPFWDYILPNLTKSITLFIWLITSVKMIHFLSSQTLFTRVAQEKIGHDFANLARKLIKILVIIAGLYWILSVWEINLTPLFASAGIAGIAVAMAAKDSLANFFGGITLFMDKTFKVGDYVIIDNNDRGEVVELGIRSTSIKTRDDVIITIPNSILANSKIINESAPIPRFRIRIPVGVAYGSDIDQVEKILLKVAGDSKEISREPEPRVRMRAFGNSSLDFELLLWVNDPRDKGLQMHYLLKEIYKAFDREGVTIPFPQLDIHYDGNGNAEVIKPDAGGSLG
ncbi:MAG: mechanosensitive ion channel family protein [Desulfobulbaceae bacterium]|nr:mechanosensitive ion channel family protein [Desulfobulbaceae bacterium]